LRNSTFVMVYILAKNAEQNDFDLSKVSTKQYGCHTLNSAKMRCKTMIYINFLELSKIKKWGEPTVLSN
jgi:hypothetical protein